VDEAGVENAGKSRVEVADHIFPRRDRLSRRKGRGLLRRAARELTIAVERLESRVLLSTTTPFVSVSNTAPIGASHTDYVVDKVIPKSTAKLNPAANSTGFIPSQIQEAYGLTGLNFGGVAGNGAGQTIAIIDAYNDPDIVADAGDFDSLFNLQQFNVTGGPTLTVEGQTGSTSSLPTNAALNGWDFEESFDV
jgi:subtilase family serine protease